MKTKFTPAPWIFGEQNGHCGISINDQYDSRIATVYLDFLTSGVNWGSEHFALKENGQSVSNAYLIAAAPEMYELLQELSEMNSEDAKLFLENSDDILKLLSKARGEK